MLSDTAPFAKLYWKSYAKIPTQTCFRFPRRNLSTPTVINEMNDTMKIVRGQYGGIFKTTPLPPVARRHWLNPAEAVCDWRSTCWRSRGRVKDAKLDGTSLICQWASLWGHAWGGSRALAAPGLCHGFGPLASLRTSCCSQKNWWETTFSLLHNALTQGFIDSNEYTLLRIWFSTAAQLKKQANMVFSTACALEAHFIAHSLLNIGHQDVDFALHQHFLRKSSFLLLILTTSLKDVFRYLPPNIDLGTTL